MRNKKMAAVLLVLVFLISAMGAGCKKKYETLDTGVSGTLDIMAWAGSGEYYQDLGKLDMSAEEFTGINEAAIYAVAKKFNEIYPNVKINLFTKIGDPNANEVSWANEIENFNTTYKKYPDIWVATQLADDVARGMVADLSVFKDDPIYKSMNPALMDMMNYYGFQAGLPQYVVPHGVFINKELANMHNIDVPGPDWTIDQYTNFVSSADKRTFWGSAIPAMNFIDTGTDDIMKSIAQREGTGDYVNLNSEQVNTLLEYVPRWAGAALWKQWDAGTVDQAVLDANGWYDVTFFANNIILTNSENPWAMGQLGKPEGDGRATSNDWDYYPRPSTPYAENTVGVLMDPLTIYNYAMEDGNPEWSEEEQNKLKIAYTFASFWVADTDAMQARADQQYMENGTLTTALNDSVPLVTGDEFDKQMEIWYNASSHQIYEGKEGFTKVMEIWESGEFYDVSDKTYPIYVQIDGNNINALQQWNDLDENAAQEYIGARCFEPNFLDAAKAKLAELSTTANSRLSEAEQSLKDGLKSYYGFADDDFTK